MQYCYIILVQGFCPLKIKITQFRDGFRVIVQLASLHSLSATLVQVDALEASW